MVVEGLYPDGHTDRRWHGLIDAHSAKLLHQFDDYHSGTGNGYHNGNILIGTTKSWLPLYTMEHPSYPGMITCDNHNDEDDPTVTCDIFKDRDDDWGDGTLANPHRTVSTPASLRDAIYGRCNLLANGYRTT
ncbi:MAG TPA: hypothetical protein VFC19_30195 [Candidatus Limnocylindrales bacterium]|nr:hypothetical protein [Candidatus Limnocylindrales bacterium]